MNPLNASRPVHLNVYVAGHCWQCPTARALAKEMAHEFPTLVVRVIDLDQPDAQQPPNVFAVPTFLLNEKIIYLGTPFREELARQIRIAFKGAKDVDQDEDRLRKPRKNRLPAQE